MHEAQSRGSRASEKTIGEERRQETGSLPAKNDLALRADSHSDRLLSGFALWCSKQDSKKNRPRFLMDCREFFYYVADYVPAPIRG